jgi:hypothetical protein
MTRRLAGKEGVADRRALRFLLTQFQLFNTPARAFAAETWVLERTLSDLVNHAYALTLPEIALMWKTAPPRMRIPQPAPSSSFMESEIPEEP